MSCVLRRNCARQQVAQRPGRGTNTWIDNSCRCADAVRDHRGMFSFTPLFLQPAPSTSNFAVAFAKLGSHRLVHQIGCVYPPPRTWTYPPLIAPHRERRSGPKSSGGATVSGSAAHSVSAAGRSPQVPAGLPWQAKMPPRGTWRQEHRRGARIAPRYIIRKARPSRPASRFFDNGQTGDGAWQSLPCG